MTEDRARQALGIVSGKIPEEKMMYFKRAPEAASDDKLDDIMCCELHNPTHILLFSVFLGGFGVDRFMIGDTGLGVGKLLLGWATCGIWPLVDIFCSYKKAKEKNLNKLITIL